MMIKFSVKNIYIALILSHLKILMSSCGFFEMFSSLQSFKIPTNLGLISCLSCGNWTFQMICIISFRNFLNFLAVCLQYDVICLVNKISTNHVSTFNQVLSLSQFVTISEKWPVKHETLNLKRKSNCTTKSPMKLNVPIAKEFFDPETKFT